MALKCATLKKIGSSSEYGNITMNNVTVGRSKDSHYHILNAFISRQHAIFRFNISNSQWTVESVGLNVLILNNFVVPKWKETLLHHMDTLALTCTSKFVFVFDSPPDVQSKIGQKKALRRLKKVQSLTITKALQEENEMLKDQLENEKRLKDEILKDLNNVEKSYKFLVQEFRQKSPNSNQDEDTKQFLPGKLMRSLTKCNGVVTRRLARDASRFIPEHRVCFVYDERMELHRNVKLNHPEQPARITSVYKILHDCGVLDRCLRLDARNATRKELLWLHTPDYIDKLSATPLKKQSTLSSLERQYDSIYLCPETYQAALLSAGSSLQVVESILKSESRSGIAVIRPPGHHAESDDALGFCFFNNTALC